MSTVAFWRTVVNDQSGFLLRVVDLLQAGDFPYCVIGGVAVNAYSYTVVTEDLDIVVAADDQTRVRAVFEQQFRVREFEHSLNVYDPNSRFQVQIQKDADLSQILERAEIREVYGLQMPVASASDLLDLKVAAAVEPTRRASKRSKDVGDIARLLEVYPDFRARLPREVSDRLFD